ncbi:MAG: hypothetical protein ABSC05_32690 [Candidatus Solibacter sp.]
MSAVVSDSSPLNYLALLSDFDLLRQIYHSVAIPPAVYREVVESGALYPVGQAVQAALGDWISIAEAPGSTQVAALRRAFHLDAGESEARILRDLGERWPRFPAISQTKNKYSQSNQSRNEVPTPKPLPAHATFKSEKVARTTRAATTVFLLASKRCV